jgi:hypothetical protein
MRLFVVLLLVACHPQPVPTRFDMARRQPPGEVHATTLGVCASMFTEGGLACVRCENAQGCIDHDAVIYCVQGSCLDDKSCKLLLPDVAYDGGT